MKSRMQGEMMSDDYAGMIEFLRKHTAAKDILTAREQECERAGHHTYIEGKSDGRCTYCYLPEGGYNSPETDASLRERQKLHSVQQPCDAAIMTQRRMKEKANQRFSDLHERIELLEKEQEGKA